MLRRIYGVETEYGITFSLRGQRRLSPDEVSRFLFRKVVAWGRSSNVFLENGSRLYLDVGSHPEYATAECDSLSDVVAQDKAGESILRELVGYAQSQVRDEGIRGDIFLFKYNTVSTGNSYGCHENYCSERIEDLSRLETVFIPFPDQPADLHRRWQGRHQRQGHRLFDEPARRAHLGSHLFGHHAESTDHQHP